MMSKERELLIKAVEWMHELKYLYANTRDAGDYDLLELIADINNIELLLAQPEVPEPIEDGELEVWYSQHTWAMDKQEYMWGFRDAEKAHGIGGSDE
jgi:hypothetical protein